jgi:hypothetical protein
MGRYDDYRPSSLDDILGKPLPKAEPPKPSLTEQRSVSLASSVDSIRELMQESGIPDSVHELLSYNVSTMVVEERKPPTLADRKEALWNIWKFFEIIDFHGGPLAFAQCHRDATDWKFRKDAQFRQLLIMARGHLKSTIFCVGYTLWRIYQNPNIRMFVGTESLKLSTAFVREIEAYLTDEWLKNYVWNVRPHVDGPLIPEMDSTGRQRRRLVKDVAKEYGENISTESSTTAKKVWRAEAIQVLRSRKLKEPTVVAGSVGQTVTGFHYDEVLFDDVVTFDNVSSDKKIDKVFSWIYDIVSVLDKPYVDMELVTQFQNCLGNQVELALRWAISGGRQTVVGTRYDEMDYYQHVIDNAEALGFESYIKNIYVNGVDNSDGYLWPEQWNERVEEEIRAQFERKYGTVGLKRFFSQYHNKIVNLDTQILDWNKINFFNPASSRLDDDGFVVVSNLDGTLKAEFKPFIVLDPTSTGGESSDYAALVVGGKYNNELFIVDFWMKKCSPTTYIDKMYEFMDKWRLSIANVEMVGGFKVLETTIRNLWMHKPDKYRPIAIKPYDPGNQQSKYERIEVTLSPIVSNGLLHMPLYCSRNSQLRRQFQFLGNDSAKDDGVDGIAILQEVAIEAKRKHVERDMQREEYNAGPYGGVVYMDEKRAEAYYEIERRLARAS